MLGYCRIAQDNAFAAIAHDLATLARGKRLDAPDVDTNRDQLPGIFDALQPVAGCPWRVEHHEPDIRLALAVLDGAASHFQPTATGEKALLWATKSPDQ